MMRRPVENDNAAMDAEQKRDSIQFVTVASIIAGFLVAAVVVWAVASGVQHRSRETLNLPSESEIQSITAQLFGSGWLAGPADWMNRASAPSTGA